MEFLFIAAVGLALIGLVIRLGFFSSSLSRDDLSDFAFSRVALRDGTTINYRERGDPGNRTLLFVHGGGDSLSAWDGWAEMLEDDHHLIAIDLPGHGLSDPYPDGNYSTERFAVSLKAFVDTMGLKEFVIVGHSFGGETVLRFVVANPDDPCAMILVAPGGYKAEHGLAVPLPIARFALSSVGKVLLRNFWSRALFTWFQHKNFFFGRSEIVAAAIERQFKLLRYGPNRGAMLSLVMHDMAHHADVTGLNGLALPALFLWGRKDRIVPLETGQRIASDVPGSQLQIYDDIGHMIHVEMASNSATDALTFLRERVDPSHPESRDPQHSSE